MMTLIDGIPPLLFFMVNCMNNSIILHANPPVLKYKMTFGLIHIPIKKTYVIK